VTARSGPPIPLLLGGALLLAGTVGWSHGPTAAPLPIPGPGHPEPPLDTLDGQRAEATAPPIPGDGELLVDPTEGTLRLLARVQGSAFLNSLPPDHQYHALVHEDGGAAAKALFTTRVSDGEIARVLRELGAQDGGGVPMAAWNLRWVPLVPQPAARVAGTPIQVTVTWEGAVREFSLAELLRDPGGEGVDMRFGGNEEHDHEWDSGCIMCLYSCPGGVISNAAYSIRDHQRGATAFEPGDDFPPDGAEVIITLTLSPPG
jgi:hypothetical protein